MCAKLPCTRNIYFSMVASDHAEYTRKADLLKTKINAMKIAKVRADRNKLHTGKEWRP